MLPEETMSKLLPIIPSTTWTGNVHRCVSGVYIDSLASTLGSKKKAGRFTKKDTFEGLYTSHYKDIAMVELTSNSLLAEMFPGEVEGVEVSFSVHVKAQRILDLTNPKIRSCLATNLQELTGDWQFISNQNEDSPTQVLGRAVFYSELFDSIRYPSKHNLGKGNLLVFPARMSHALIATNLPEKFPDQIEL